ncbi:ABC transporter ATP-binding protein [Spiribacter sp. 218]|uniref:ABC transporter ATP-binding protein n=1 Tax=Spiribacter pallidus TaxID=1987936 RepID=UPI00349F8964
MDRLQGIDYVRSVFGIEGADARWMAVGGFVVIFVISLIGAFCVTIARSAVLRNFVNDISERLFGAYISAPYIYHLDINSAQLIRNLNQEVTRTSNSFLSVLQLTMNVLTIGAVFGLLLTQEAAVAVGAAVVNGGAGIGILIFLRKRARQLGRRLREEQGRMIQIISQAMAAIRETRVLSREPQFFQQYSQCVRSATDTQHKRQIISGIVRPVLRVTGLVSLGAVCGILYWQSGALEPILPTVALFAGAFMRILPAATSSVQALTQLYFRSVSATAVARDLHDLRGEEVLSEVQFPWSDGLLTFSDRLAARDVWFTYPGKDEPAVRGVSLEVRKGEMIGFVGETGSGKTTMADLLIGVLHPDAGQVTLDHVDVHRDIENWQGLLGVVPQSIYLLDDSVRANVAFGLPAFEVDDERVWQALEDAQMAERIAGLEGGLDARVGEGGAMFSGGERQRLGLARAIYAQPEILLLDESTSSLDNRTERAIMDNIAGMRGARTLLVIAHRLSTVRDCDRIFVFDRGEVVASGRYDELVENSAHFRQIADIRANDSGNEGQDHTVCHQYQLSGPDGRGC